MFDWRTLFLGVTVFAATFGVGWWSGIAAWMTPVAVSDAKPTPAAVNRPATGPQFGKQKVAARQPQGPGLTEDEKLRQGVVTWSKVYRAPACNQDARSMYVIAATKYAEALMRSAGCNNFPKCPMSENMLDRVWQANRSSADQRVAVAMAAAHAAGGLSDASFRGDVGRAVRVIAGRDFASGPVPACSSSSSSSSRRFRIRIRR
jgi:hypothetical protein